MQYLKTGDFFGITRNVFENDSISISESEYVSEMIDWHYHANAYFSFILSGNLIDKNKSYQYSCSPGTLLFHRTQDPHVNIMKSKRIRSLHVEFKKSNITSDLLSLDFHGDLNITNPDIKASSKMGSYLKEMYHNDYIAVGGTFNTGTYSAYGPMKYYQIHTSYPGTAEYLFSKCRYSDFLIDLRKIPENHLLLAPIGFRSIGSTPQETTQFAEINLSDNFDIIYFLSKSDHSNYLNE